MYVETNVREVKTGLPNAPQAFTVKAGGKLFSALTKNVYTDPIGSIPRELVANGVDANREAGHNHPVRVYMPSRLRPELRVIDDGVGMSKEFMLGTDPNSDASYLSVFSSTKDQSNQDIGGWGIGRLTPLHYTDAYSVVSRHGGLKCTYAVYKDTEGVPTLALVQEEPCDDTGVEVIVPVKPESASDFTYRLHWLSYLDPKPEVHGASIPDPDLWMRTGNAALRKDVGQWNHDITIVMGGIPYKFSNSNNEVKKVIPGLTLFVPIGTFPVSLSRESLSVDADVMQQMQTMANEARTAIEAKALDNLFNTTTYPVERIEASTKLENKHRLDVPLDKIFGNQLHYLAFDPREYGDLCQVGKIEPSKWDNKQTRAIYAANNNPHQLLDNITFKQVLYAHSRKKFQSKLNHYRDQYDRTLTLVVHGPRHLHLALVSWFGPDRVHDFDRLEDPPKKPTVWVNGKKRAKPSCIPNVKTRRLGNLYQNWRTTHYDTFYDLDFDGSDHNDSETTPVVNCWVESTDGRVQTLSRLAPYLATFGLEGVKVAMLNQTNVKRAKFLEIPTLGNYVMDHLEKRYPNQELPTEPAPWSEKAKKMVDLLLHYRLQQYIQDNPDSTLARLKADCINQSDLLTQSAVDMLNSLFGPAHYIGVAADATEADEALCAAYDTYKVAAKVARNTYSSSTIIAVIDLIEGIHHV